MTSQSLNTNIKTIQERTNDKVLTYEYMYDTLNRLIRVTKNNQITEEYSYDNQGNRLSSTINGQTTTASYNSEDQLLTYGNNIYSYDNDGRLMKKQNNEGITSYKYDAFGNLKEVILPNSDKITYMYNANNQRTVKLINNQTEEKYLWLDQITLLAVYDKDNNIKYRFTYTNERTPISYTDKESNVYYLSYNHQGSLKAITNQSNQIVKSIDYDSFGNILEEVYYDGNGNVIQNNPTLDIPIGFAGGLYDKDTKLIKFGYREYDSNTGRWTSKDPIDFGGGSSNLYGYVLGDPVNYVDPTGEWAWVAGVVITVIGIYIAKPFIDNAVKAKDSCDNIKDPIVRAECYHQIRPQQLKDVNKAAQCTAPAFPLPLGGAEDVIWQGVNAIP